jgi:pimeloyl-ACP methyl ester carboxylesterase
VLPLCEMSPPKQNRKPPLRPVPARPIPYKPELQQEVVDPRWLAKALGITILAAVFCAWLALCGLYYQGSWQLVLHPAHAVSSTPASLGIPFEAVRFDSTENGQPRLSGWWLPAFSQPGGLIEPKLETPPRYSADTILYLHDGSGSLSNTLPTLELLHSAGVNLFAIDYRGFGASNLSQHPDAVRMQDDASAALRYLVTTRHIPAERIIPYGVGLGASIAAALAQSHPELPALILDNPDPDPAATAAAGHRSRLVPIRLLYHEDFKVDALVQTLPVPKLLLVGGPNARPDAAQLSQLQQLYAHAASPSLSVSLPLQDYTSEYRTALARFLDQYLPPPALPR